MTPPVIARWTSISESGRTDELDAQLAERIAGRQQNVEQTIVPAISELLQQWTVGDGPLRPASPRLRPSRQP